MSPKVSPRTRTIPRTPSRREPKYTCDPPPNLAPPSSAASRSLSGAALNFAASSADQYVFRAVCVANGATIL